MRLGNKIFLIIFLIFSIFNFLLAEEKITTSPLINVEEIKPSFEELDEDNINTSSNLTLKEKKKNKNIKKKKKKLIVIDKKKKKT